MMDFSSIESKWHNNWEKANLYKSKVDKKKKKFFMIFAYPGISGFLHVGHLRGYTYTDVICRHKRMLGYNVLFPVGTHASGNQAISFANKVKNRDEQWINYLKNNGCDFNIINKLDEPNRVIEFFNSEYLRVWKKFGFLFDWQRFICTVYDDYNKFIEWQFKKLNKKRLLVQKPYYATFCPNCGPVAVDPSETDISKGGNAEKVEYTLLKFKLGNEYIVAATLRPETVYGQTNMWVNPEVTYYRARIEGETWILSKEAVGKLKFQKKSIEVVGHVHGKELIGKCCIAPGVEREIPILPASFCDPNVGSGFVTSVPSDAPYDYIALKELQESKELCGKYNLDYEKIKGIELISIIRTKGYGDFPAKEICEKLDINHLDEKEKLEKATQEIYKAGFHTGVMNENCGKYARMKVTEAKDLIKEELTKENKSDFMWDLSEEVICRCGNSVIIKKITDQWFIKYSDKKLKEKSKEHAGTMKILPNIYYENLPGIIDWFDDRACARLGNWLGTKLPFDEKYIIEPIADSTLYPIYYLISPYVNSGKLRIDQLSEEFFDYVFLDHGDAKTVIKKTKINKNLLKDIKEEVDYWYPLDINLGGKEHQTVHFPVFLMNHVAVLPKRFWPSGVLVNWWVTGKGDKISKSKGGAEPITEAIKKYSVDAMRLYYCHSGSPYVDVIWDSDLVFNYKVSLEKIFSTIELLAKAKNKINTNLDNWLVYNLNEKIKEINKHFENYDLRAVSDLIYFSIYNDLKWYIRRQGSNKKVIKDFLEAWIKLMSVVTPHIAEELWQQTKHKGFVSIADWPIAKEVKEEHSEKLIEKVLGDINAILKLANIEKPKKLFIYTAPKWKYDILGFYLENKDKTQNELIKKFMKDPKIKKYGKEVINFINYLIKNKPSSRLEDEFKVIEHAKDFFKKEASIKLIKVWKADDKKIKDPGKKASKAEPMRPAIYVE